ncbi:MAG: TetR/AcrR family transcriptional regulator, partial [Lachnospiraceae bacterium]
MKDKIAKTCVQMLRTRNLDEITVCDVAKQCGISRQAFYYYFENIESALLYSAEGMLDYLRQKCTEIRDP